MGDSTSEQRPDRRGRRRSSGSSVLTPPTGLPGLADLNAPTWQPPAPPERRPPATPTVVKPCACGHGKDAHEHYRPGSDCGVCGAADCEEFRPVGGTMRRALRRLGLAG